MSFWIWTGNIDDGLVGYYPSHAHDEIAALLGKKPWELSDDFEREIIGVLIGLEDGERLRHSPQKYSRDILKRISRQARALADTLQGIDEHSWDALNSKLSINTEPDQSENGIKDHFSTEYNNSIDELIVRLGQLQRSAESSLDSFRQSGRPTNKDIPWAIKKLRRIWTNITKTDPKLAYDKKTGTRGNFLRFCQVVLTPILSGHGSPLKLERAVKDELYGQNPRRRPRGKNP